MFKKISLLIIASGISISVFANNNINTSCDPCEPGGSAWNEFVTECNIDPSKAIDDWKATCPNKLFIPMCPIKVLN